jgi:hypothetical protein
MTTTEVLSYVYDDGGRAAAGFKGKTGDCVTRAVAIATGLPYKDLYDEIIELAKSERPRKPKVRSHPRTGVWPQTTRKLMEAHGFIKVVTKGIGTGCIAHLLPDELPDGIVVANVSRHEVAVIDGVVHDISNPTRDGTRDVSSYWILADRNDEKTVALGEHYAQLIAEAAERERQRKERQRRKLGYTWTWTEVAS